MIDLLGLLTAYENFIGSESILLHVATNTEEGGDLFLELLKEGGYRVILDRYRNVEKKGMRIPLPVMTKEDLRKYQETPPSVPLILSEGESVYIDRLDCLFATCFSAYIREELAKKRQDRVLWQAGDGEGYSKFYCGQTYTQLECIDLSEIAPSPAPRVNRMPLMLQWEGDQEPVLVSYESFKEQINDLLMIPETPATEFSLIESAGSVRYNAFFPGFTITYDSNVLAKPWFYSVKGEPGWSGETLDACVANHLASWTLPAESA